MTPDRDLVREALAAWDLYMLEPLRVPSVEHADALVAAARAWLEQENAITERLEAAAEAWEAVMGFGPVDRKAIAAAVEAYLRVSP